MSDNPNFPGPFGSDQPGTPSFGSPTPGPFGPLDSPPGLGPDGFAQMTSRPLPMDAPGGKSRKAKRVKAQKTPKNAGEQSPKGATKRAMGTTRWLAIGCAVVAGLAIMVFLSATPTTKYVVVTKAGVPALTQITSSQITAVTVTEAGLASGAYTGSSVKAAVAKAMAAVKNESTSIPLVKGQQVFAGAFSKNSRLGGSLGVDDRLISVSAEVSSAVGGTLSVGDQVDVISSTSGTVATSATVVSIQAAQSAYDNAASSQTGSLSTPPAALLPTSPVPGIYILKTTSENAVAIAQASGSGGGAITLDYRAPVAG